MVEFSGYTQPYLVPLPYRYVIDACSIISQKDGEPHRRRVYKTLWKNIDEYVASQKIITCAEIKEEVEDESLKAWLETITIVETDQEIQNNVTKIVNTPPYLVDIRNMKSSGDPFLIATAMKYEIAVITEENKDSPKKIPAVCRLFEIECYNLTELAEKEGWSF